LLDVTKFELRFHGTSIDNARRIFEVGFDPAMRKRSQHGRGDYVGDFPTAVAYETENGDQGAMVVVLVFTGAPGVVTHVPGHRIVVVDNPTDGSATYCLALGTFNDDATSQDVYSAAGSTAPPPPSSVTVHYIDDKGKWARVDAGVERIIGSARAAGRTTVTLTFNKFTYLVDFVAMTQTNQQTGKVRQLHIK
ncbi:MAG: WWE domain-containing protein, partial [Flavobacteriaceae bacterium]|nr:WWE domain-containing protein [Flavobacteriaceae bacterium]